MGSVSSNGTEKRLIESEKLANYLLVLFFLIGFVLVDQFHIYDYGSSRLKIAKKIFIV